MNSPMHTPPWHGARWAALARAAFILSALWLAGCTTYVQTQVTAFSNWNGGSDATRTYAFTRQGEQQNSIEQSTYEALVAGELSKYNFRQVPESSARYAVALAYSVRGDLMTVRQPVYYDPWPMYGPWGRPYWGGPWGGWGGYGPWGPTGYVDQSYPVYIHALQIRMTDKSTGREVYKVTAVNSTDDASLYGAMPYLTRSALADFPLGNGTVRTVTIPVDKNGGMGNEQAASLNGNERSVTPAPAVAPPQ